MRDADNFATGFLNEEFVMSVSLGQLHYYLTIVEEGAVSKASETRVQPGDLTDPFCALATRRTKASLGATGRRSENFCHQPSRLRSASAETPSTLGRR